MVRTHVTGDREDRQDPRPNASLPKAIVVLADMAQSGGPSSMIEVTRLNGITMLVNSDLIKIAESSPDTMLTLISGEKLIIRESCEELLDKIMGYRSALLAAVSHRLGAQGELPRMAALVSLSAESGVNLAGHHNEASTSQVIPYGGTHAGPTVVTGRSLNGSLNGLKLESSGR